MSSSVVGPWANEKLNRLKAYLNAYTTIMKGRSGWCERYYYVDAFAGPGSHMMRHAATTSPLTQALWDVSAVSQQQEEQRTYIDGSPRVALSLQHPFTHYIFLELAAERIAALSKLRGEFGESRRITIHQGDCNSYLLSNFANSASIDWRKNRAVVFLDPFGMQVPWSTLEALGRTRGIEVFLNFPVAMAIQRLLKRRSETFSEAERAALDDYFGTPDWFHVLYQSKPTLFGDSVDEKVANSGEVLLKWYQERLRGAFGYVSTATLIRNTKGGHLYYLLLATPNKTGVKIASHILSK